MKDDDWTMVVDFCVFKSNSFKIKGSRNSVDKVKDIQRFHKPVLEKYKYKMSWLYFNNINNFPVQLNTEILLSLWINPL